MRASLTIVLLASLAPSLSFAAAPDVKPIEHATEVMANCGKIADEIGAMKAPAGLAQSRMMQASNEHAFSKGFKHKIDPAHEGFMGQMHQKVHSLDECGKEYQTAVKASEAQLQTLGKANLAGADEATVSKAFEAYNAQREKLEASIAKLSEDRQVQSFVHRTIRKYFLDQKVEDETKEAANEKHH